MANIRGWKNKEREDLIKRAKRAKVEGTSLKQVFIEFAEKYKRKPDSVRNYYYSVILESENRGKKIDGLKKAKIKVFTKSECEKLLSEILCSCAKGKSVRAAILSLSQNKKTALRYQNKYRNLLVYDRPLVEKVMLTEKKKGLYYDPYKKTVVEVAPPEKILYIRDDKLPIFTEFESAKLPASSVKVAKK